MGQTYVHRFEYRDGASKSDIDAAWAEAFKAFARSGNWGGVEKDDMDGAFAEIINSMR